jgi:tetratricopeptide (TPR) repeat protein
VKRALALLTVLILAATGGAVAYQAAARQRDYRAALARGDAALKDDQTFTAIEAYSGAIELRPDSMLASLRRGQTYQRRGGLGDLDAAARDFRTASRLDPAATRPLEELGDVLYQLQRYTPAAEAYERGLRLDDRSARVGYKLAVARFHAGDIDAALAALNQVVRLDGGLPEAYSLLGVCLREKRRAPDALRAFERAVALAPGLIQAREELADLYGGAGRRGEELEQLQVLAGLDRDRVERQVAIGLAHARAGHADLAVLTLGSALERWPDEPLLYRALGQVWLDTAQSHGDPVALSKAREALERVASGPGASSESLVLYGRALLQGGDAEAAERVLQQATTRFPVEPAAFLFYASTAERQTHIAAAREALIRYGGLISSDPDFVSRASRIAALSLRLNDERAAVKWLAQAASASPGDLRLVAALADAQVRAGDQSAARTTITRGLEKDPQNAALLRLARRVKPPS